MVVDLANGLKDVIDDRIVDSNLLGDGEEEFEAILPNLASILEAFRSKVDLLSER